MATIFAYRGIDSNFKIPESSDPKYFPKPDFTLSNVTFAKVTQGENQSYELQVTFYEESGTSGQLKIGTILSAPTAKSYILTMDAYDFFEVYRIVRDAEGKVTAYAEHISYKLSNLFFKPMGNVNISTIGELAGYLGNTEKFIYGKGLNSTTFKFYHFEDVSKLNLKNKLCVQKPLSVRSILSKNENTDSDQLWDENEVKVVFKRNKIYFKKPVCSKKIVYGASLNKFEENDDATSTECGVLPYWQDSEDSSICVYGDPQYLDTTDSLTVLPAKILSFKDSYKEKPTKEQLEKSAQTWLKNHQSELGNGGYIPSKVNASFFMDDTTTFNTIEIGNFIEAHIPKRKLMLKIKSFVFDCLTEEYRDIKLENETNKG